MHNFSNKYWYPMLAHLTWSFDFCAQLTLNGLYQKKLQFSRYSNETCSIQLLSSRRLIWAIVESDWTKNEIVMLRWKNVAFRLSVHKSSFQFPEKLMKFFVETLDSAVKKSEKNYGDNIFDLSPTIFCKFAIYFFFFSFISL